MSPRHLTLHSFYRSRYQIEMLCEFSFSCTAACRVVVQCTLYAVIEPVTSFHHEEAPHLVSCILYLELRACHVEEAWKRPVMSCHAMPCSTIIALEHCSHCIRSSVHNRLVRRVSIPARIVKITLIHSRRHILKRKPNQSSMELCVTSCKVCSSAGIDMQRFASTAGGRVQRSWESGS